MKNAFYFILKALFVLIMYTFLSWNFGHVEKTAWLKRWDKHEIKSIFHHFCRAQLLKIVSDLRMRLYNGKETNETQLSPNKLYLVLCDN